MHASDSSTSTRLARCPHRSLRGEGRREGVREGGREGERESKRDPTWQKRDHVIVFCTHWQGLSQQGRCTGGAGITGGQEETTGSKEVLGGWVSGDGGRLQGCWGWGAGWGWLGAGGGREGRFIWQGNGPIGCGRFRVKNAQKGPRQANMRPHLAKKRQN